MKMSMVMRRLLAAGIMAVSGAATAFGQSDFETKIEADGVVLGFANEAPYAYSLPTGELAGIDYEILKTVLGKFGVSKIEASLVEWGALIPGLRAGRFDVVSSAVYMKPERCAQVAFSEPMYQLGDGLIVLAGNPKNIHSFDAFVNDRSLKLANTIGATGPGGNALAAGVRPDQILDVPDPASQIAALKAGRVDAALNTGPQSGELVASSKDSSIERADPFQQAIINGKPAVGIAGIAFNPVNAEFVEKFDEILLAFRATPEYVALLEKYNMTAGDIPTPEMTREAICAGTVN
jgi:polar amino acid transport system substrate-binding protein